MQKQWAVERSVVCKYNAAQFSTLYARMPLLGPSCHYRVCLSLTHVLAKADYPRECEASCVLVSVHAGATHAHDPFTATSRCRFNTALASPPLITFVYSWTISKTFV